MRAIARSLSPTSGIIFSFGLARKDSPAQHSEPSNYDTGLHEDSKQHIHHGQRPEQNEYHNQSRHDPALLFWVATFHCPRREGKKQTKRCSTKLSSATASIMNCWSVRMHLLRVSLTGAVALFCTRNICCQSTAARSKWLCPLSRRNSSRGQHFRG